MKYISYAVVVFACLVLFSFYEMYNANSKYSPIASYQFFAPVGMKDSEKNFKDEFFYGSAKDDRCYIVTDMAPVFLLRGDNQGFIMLLDKCPKNKTFKQYDFILPDSIPSERITVVRQSYFQKEYLDNYFNEIARDFSK